MGEDTILGLDAWVGRVARWQQHGGAAGPRGRLRGLLAADWLHPVLMAGARLLASRALWAAGERQEKW